MNVTVKYDKGNNEFLQENTMRGNKGNGEVLIFSWVVREDQKRKGSHFAESEQGREAIWQRNSLSKVLKLEKSLGSFRNWSKGEGLPDEVREAGWSPAPLGLMEAEKRRVFDFIFKEKEVIEGFSAGE